MRHWLLLSIRNWSAKPGRTAAALTAIALGVGVVIWVTCAYESVRLALSDQVWFWIGRSHLSVESMYGAEGTVIEDIAEQVRKDPNVAAVTFRLRQQMLLIEERPTAGSGPAGGRPDSELPASRPSPASAPLSSELGTSVDAYGIDPATEYDFRKYDEDRVAGRVLAPGDASVAVLDQKLAAQLGIELGDRISLQTQGWADEPGEQERRAEFTIVGLISHRQIAKQQRPLVMVMLRELQALTGYDKPPSRVTKIDMQLHDPKKIRATETGVFSIVQRYRQGFLVTSSEAKLKQVQGAERQSGLVLMLVSCVALFTAFFIILSTLSMGMLERTAQLGTLRCLGTTRLQIAALTLAEAVPLGLVGITLGIPVGLLLAQLSVWMAPEYIGQFAISRSGLTVALIGGAVTTLAGALLPTLQAMRVSPLEASKPLSKSSSLLWSVLAFVIGAAMIGAHVLMVERLPANKWLLPQYAIGTLALLYGGYALVSPLLVWVFAQFAVRLAAVALRVRYTLLADQVGRAAWRSAAICCGLMVGLSLIVSLVVHSQSLAAGWNFPADFCEAFVFVSPPVDRARAEQTRRMPGIRSSALANERIRCTVYGGGLLHFPTSRFVAGDPEDFFRIAKLEFKEGNQEEAIAKLKQGGYILVTPEFVRAKNRGYGDKVRIKGSGDMAIGGEFTIAGVVTSPALDIAANYFNAGGQLVSASVHVVLGTLEDARRVFKLPDEVSMFLVNFDLPPTTPTHPPEFDAPIAPKPDSSAAMLALLRAWRPLMPERAADIDYALAGTPGWTPLVRAFAEALTTVRGEWSGLSPVQRWQNYREEVVMMLVAQRTGANWEQHASVRALKLQIDRDLRRATLLFATIPAVALIVAALGVGNLMMANVTSRTRQIAMLRAIGATRSQIIRLVVGEAVVLGVLGSFMGLLLGLHAAYDMNSLTLAIWSYQPDWTIPWDLVIPGVIFTMAVCLIAGIIPARIASRNNIIDAMQTT